MKLSQELLRAETARRISAARPELAARLDLASMAGLRAAQEEVGSAAGAGDVLAAVVIRSLDLAGWTRATCAFALGLRPGLAENWRRSFTRTVFLAGNPDNLVDRFRFDHVSDDRSLAWLGPAAAEASGPLRRLLKLFGGSRAMQAQRPKPIVIPGAPERRVPVRRDLYVATAGVSTSHGLVGLNHLLVEAVMDGLVGPGDLLTLRQVPRLAGLSVPMAAIRADVEPDRPERLQASACLTEEMTYA
jgi:hypothetical protein